MPRCATAHRGAMSRTGAARQNGSFDAWRRGAARGDARRSFCRTVEESSLAANPRHAGIEARHRRRDAQGSGTTRSGASPWDAQVLTNVFVLTEGWDAAREELSPPRAAARTGDLPAMVGRVPRPYEDQRAPGDRPAGVTHEHGRLTRTARSPSTASRASPRRATVALAVPFARPVVEGIKRGPRPVAGRVASAAAHARRAQRFKRSPRLIGPGGR